MINISDVFCQSCGGERMELTVPTMAAIPVLYVRRNVF
jgi:hypothetical protein